MLRTTIIISAIIIAALASGWFTTNMAKEKDVQEQNVLIATQQQIIKSALQTEGLLNGTEANIIKQINQIYGSSHTDKVAQLYHSAILYMIWNNTKTINLNTAKLDALIAAHNSLIQGIENATGKPAVVNNYYHTTKNSYCTINQVYVPKLPCKK